MHHEGHEEHEETIFPQRRKKAKFETFILLTWRLGGRLFRHWSVSQPQRKSPFDPPLAKGERRRFRLLLTPVVMLVCLTGCMVGPDYNRPSMEIPPQFRAATTSDTTSIADLKWFEVFQDEPLQELIRSALAQNYDLRDAIARVDASRANLGITRADQYPNFGVGGDVSAVELSRQGQFSIPKGTSRQRTFGTVFLDLFTYEIDIWGRLRRATEAARADLLAADWNRRAVVTTLISDVATAYFNLLELDMELAIAKNTFITRAESLRVIRVQQLGGIATRLDVRQGEQLVYTAGESIPSTEQQIEQTENQINLLLGKTPGPVARGRVLTEQQTPPEVPAGLPSSLLAGRPGL